jgi:hypothetical protein
MLFAVQGIILLIHARVKKKKVVGIAPIPMVVVMGTNSAR